MGEHKRREVELTEVVAVVVVYIGAHHPDRPPSRDDGDDHAERHRCADADLLKAFDPHSPCHQPGKQGEDEVSDDVVHFNQGSARAGSYM